MLRCGTGLGFSLRTVPITRNWADSSNPPSGSIKPIPPIGEHWHPALWAITFRSPSPSHWPRWPWSQIRNTPSSPSFCPTGAKHSIRPKDTVVACEDERAGKEWDQPLTYRREGIFLYRLLRSMRSSCYAVLHGELPEHLLKHAQVDTASTCSSKWPGLVWRMTAAIGDTAHLTGRVSPRRQPSNSFRLSSRRTSPTISTPL